MAMNRIFKHISMGIFCSCLSMSLLAAPAKLSSVQQLIQVGEINALMINSLDELNQYFDKQAEQIIVNITGNPNLTTEQQLAALEISALMKSSSKQIINNPKTQQAIEKIYLDNYTEAEVQAGLRFLNTPEGRSINRKNAKIMGQISEYMMSVGEKMHDDAAMRDNLQEDVLKILQPIMQKNADKPASN